MPPTPRTGTIAAAALGALARVAAVPGHAREAMSPPNMAYLLVEDRDALGFYASVDPECGIEEAELDRLVEGVLIRHRIRPMGDAHSDEGLNLEIHLACFAPDEDGQMTYSIDAGFSLVQPDGADLLINHGYGAFGTGDASFVLGAARESVEDALTDFIAANWHLTGEDERTI